MKQDFTPNGRARNMITNVLDTTDYYIKGTDAIKCALLTVRYINELIEEHDLMILTELPSGKKSDYWHEVERELNRLLESNNDN